MWFLIWENAARKGGRFRLAETRATHFDKKRAWNANCVQTQSGGGDGGIRTHVPISGQNDFESFSLRPLRYISILRFGSPNQQTTRCVSPLSMKPYQYNRFCRIFLVFAGKRFLFFSTLYPPESTEKSLRMKIIRRLLKQSVILGI